MKMVDEVCVGRPPVGALVLHQVALQGFLAGVALLHQQQLRQKDTQSGQRPREAASKDTASNSKKHIGRIFLKP